VEATLLATDHVLSSQHARTLGVLWSLFRRSGRPVREDEIADELDVLLTADELPPPVELLLRHLQDAGLSMAAADGWAPLDASSTGVPNCPAGSARSGPS